MGWITGPLKAGVQVGAACTPFAAAGVIETRNALTRLTRLARARRGMVPPIDARIIPVRHHRYSGAVCLPGARAQPRHDERKTATRVTLVSVDEDVRAGPISGAHTL